MSERRVAIAPGRLGRWVEGFGERHDGVTTAVDDGAWLLTGGDGATARLSGWLPVPADAEAPVPEQFAAPEPLAVLLLRRGGYAVAVRGPGERVLRKNGTRYVQSRTAAGGWSQQRYARRRGNQADELVGAAAGHLVGFLRQTRGAGAVVVGGDKLLVSQALGLAELAGLAALPTRTRYDVADPRADVLTAVLRTADDAQALLRDPA